jgi:hypothetical protein
MPIDGSPLGAQERDSGPSAIIRTDELKPRKVVSGLYRLVTPRLWTVELGLPGKLGHGGRLRARHMPPTLRDRFSEIDQSLKRIAKGRYVCFEPAGYLRPYRRGSSGQRGRVTP